MDTPDAPSTSEKSLQKPAKKDGSVRFTVVMMLLALLCVGITLAIAFHDMMAP